MSEQAIKEVPAAKTPRPYNFFIAIPTRGEFKAEMALCLCFLVHLITCNPIQRINGELRFIKWAVHRKSGSVLSSLRQQLVDMAVDGGVDTMLFLDDDMKFDPEFIFDWIREDRPVIAMNCPTRSVPTYPTARQASVHEPFKGNLVYSDVA